MKAKIQHVKPAEIFSRASYGTNYVKGDYNTGSRLFEVKTDKGIFNLDRSEIISVCIETGVKIGINVTMAVLQGLVGKVFDTDKIKDK